jgi:hypothetical protein
MAHTRYVSVLAQGLFNLINTNKSTLGIDEVYYGDQALIPVATACVITAGPKTTTLAGVSGPGGRVFRDMTVYIGIHRQVVVDTLNADAGTEAFERLNTEQLGEVVESLIHQDTTVGGLIIHGFVTAFEPGNTQFSNSMFRTVRLTFVGRTKLNLSI